jgi:hypothetical protein
LLNAGFSMAILELISRVHLASLIPTPPPPNTTVAATEFRASSLVKSIWRHKLPVCFKWYYWKWIRAAFKHAVYLDREKSVRLSSEKRIKQWKNTNNGSNKDWTNLWRQFAVGNKLFTVSTNTCATLVWNFTHVTFASSILKWFLWLLDIWKFCWTPATLLSIKANEENGALFFFHIEACKCLSVAASTEI